MKKNNKIELLAPAKDKISAILAINYGADAIYMGASAFGARAKASNSTQDIKEVVDYAHKFNAKVYVTINTILNDEELKTAVGLIYKLYEIGADAIIIQDMGLLECELPPIRIFASTQCHNDSLEKVQFLEKSGISRVILARELSIDEIQNIAQNTNIELEAFIHGSLCVCYSGQCYLSYAIGRRSANKGECAQPCRKKYSVMDSYDDYLAQDKYLLSLKDLNASEHLKDLIEAGITSFKIEGRLKDEHYIKNVVSYYRKKMDEIISPEQKTSEGSIILDFEPNLDKSFNRGFTDYFLKGRNKNIFSPNTPKALGERVGKVKYVSKNYFVLEEGSLNQSDGICFFKDNELKGSNINNVENEKIYPQNISGIEKDTIIYRNLDFEFEKKLKNSTAKRKIEAKICIKTAVDNIVFEIEDENSNKTRIFIENTFEIAQNEQKMLENIKNQFQKTAESEFSVSELNISLNQVPFMPVSKLNEIRRELLEKLSLQRLENYEFQRTKIEKTDHPYIKEELDFSSNIMNSKAKEFYQRHHAEISEMALETGLSAMNKKVMTTKHCILYALDKCKKKHKTPEKLFLVDEKGRKYRLNFDCKNCQMEIIF
ncbi:MAG: U32 family peptidase [bacterium]